MCVWLYFLCESLNILIQDILLTARPRYRRNVKPLDGLERIKSIDNEGTDPKNEREGSQKSKLASQRSRTLKWAIQQYTPVQASNLLYNSRPLSVFCKIFFTVGI